MNNRYLTLYKTTGDKKIIAFYTSGISFLDKLSFYLSPIYLPLVQRFSYTLIYEIPIQ